MLDYNENSHLHTLSSLLHLRDYNLHHAD